MSPKTFAVIGSNCFTGSHIVDGLLEDPQNDVIGISRSPEKTSFFLPYKRHQSKHFKFFQNDLVRQPKELIAILDAFQPNCVIHVAALSEVALSNHQPVEYFETNSVGVVRLCNELRQRKYLRQYIHISSAEVYGSCPEPLTELAPLNPSTPYAASKAAADHYLLTLHRNFGFPVMLIRSTNVYGRHQQLYKIIPRTIIKVKNKEKLELHGGGRAVKTWIHVRDVVQGILQCHKKGVPGGIYHFSDVNEVSVRELVKQVCDLMKCDFNSLAMSVDERLGQDARYVLDYSLAQRELGWSPKIKFTDGVQETIQWLEQNWSLVSSQSLVYEHQ